MALRTYKVPNLTNGVSQQPESLKFSTQAVKQVNAYSDPTKGLTKRPSSKYVKTVTLSNAYDDGVFIHTIKRSNTEKYTVIINNSLDSNDEAEDPTVDIYNQDGTVCTIGQMVNGSIVETTGTVTEPYLLVGPTESSSKIKAVTALDATFLINTDKTVGMSSAEGNVNTYTNNDTALVWIKQGDYEKKYEITIGTNTYSYTSGKSLTDATPALQQAKSADSERIAAGLRGGKDDPDAGSANDDGDGLLKYVTNAYTNTAITAEDLTSVDRYGNLLVLKNTGGIASISVDDGLAGFGIGLAYKAVDNLIDLPITAPKGFKIKVHGSLEGDEDDYFVEFQTNDESLSTDDVGEGTWTECLGWDTTATNEAPVRKALTDSSMPFILKNTAVNTFTLLEGEWGERTVGTEESNKTPSFVGKKISNAFLFKDRLGFLCEDKIIMSEVSYYYNFFRKTVRVLKDSTPIDLTVSSDQIVDLKYAIPFNNQLLLFANNAQFSLRSGDEALTSKTIAVVHKSSYELDTSVTPIVLDSQVYFGFKRGDKLGIYEYFIADDNNNFQGVEITEHVPSYIEHTGKQVVMTGSSKERVIAVLDTSSYYSCHGGTCDQARRNKIKIYKYFWKGREKVQSSWFEFELDRYIDIYDISFVDSELWIYASASSVGTRTTSFFFMKIDFSENKLMSSATNYHLDHVITNADCVVSYDSVTDKTTYTLPYDVFRGDYTRLRVLKNIASSSGTEATYNETAFTKPFSSTTQFILEGDTTSSTYTIGLTFEMEYQFSTPSLKDTGGNGGRVPIMNMRNQIRNGKIAYENSGYFEVSVTVNGRDAKTSTFNGHTLGSTQSVPLNDPNIVSHGVFKFPVYSKAENVVIKLSNSTHLPSQFISAEFESFIHGHSTRTSG